MSSLHQSSEGLELLEVVDDLRRIERLEDAIPLPRIVVAGHQSSGKSSVLHAISGIDFPTSTGACTRFPIEIVLSRRDEERARASLKPYTEDEAMAESFAAFGERWTSLSIEQLSSVIDDAKEVLGISETRAFCDDSLVLEFWGPDKEHLTLVDLPGIFTAVSSEQQAGNIAFVNEMVDRYLRPESTIILVVIKGSYGLDQQGIIQKVQHDGLLKLKALGVLTAPDCIYDNATLEDEAFKLVKDNSRSFGHGCHVLRNLSDNEKVLNKNRDIEERKFFERSEPWASLSHLYWGNSSLKGRLSEILKKEVFSAMPTIKANITTRLAEIDQELAEMGTSRSTPGELRNFLVDCAENFVARINLMTSGTTPVSSMQAGTTVHHLRASMENRFREYATALLKHGRVWRCEGGSDVELDEEHALHVYQGEYNLTQLVHGTAMVKVLFRDIEASRGKQLHNLVHPDWAAIVFKKQSRRWEEITAEHVDDICEEVKRYVYEALRSTADLETTARLWVQHVQPALDQRTNDLQMQLRQLLRPYSQPSIHCFSPRYQKLVAEWAMPEGISTEEAQYFHVLRSAEVYYDIASETYVENVINLGVENCLLDNLQGLLQTRTINKMSDETLERLGSESPKTRARRQKLLKEKTMFEKARDQVLPKLATQRYKSSQIPSHHTNFDVVHLNGSQ